MSDELPIATWRTASPESQGLDSTVLAEALEYVRTQRLPLHSLLIVRNSIMVLEAYFWPYQGDEIHDVASVTKSFTSAAVGIELERCLVRGVDEKVRSIFPSAVPASDPRKTNLAIRHLLTMT